MECEDSIGFRIPVAGFQILPLWISEKDFGAWIPDSFFSGVLVFNAQYSGFPFMARYFRGGRARQRFKNGFGVFFLLAFPFRPKYKCFLRIWYPTLFSF